MRGKGKRSELATSAKSPRSTLSWTVDTSTTQALDEGRTLVCSLLVLTGLTGAACLEANQVRVENRTNAALKSLLGWFLPAAVFLWIGLPVAQWALAAPLPIEKQLGQAVRFGLFPGILSGILSERLRFQPFVLGVCILAGFVLPFALTLEWFLQVFRWPFLDQGGLGMTTLATAGFALAAVPFLGFRQASEPAEPPSPDPAATVNAHLALCLAWIAATAGSAPSIASASTSAAALVVAGAAALVGQLSLGWIQLGTAPPRYLLRAPLKGILAALPAAAYLSPEGGAVCGLLGLAASQGCRIVLTRIRMDDRTGTASTHLGSGLVGLVLAPLLCSAHPTAWVHALRQWGLALAFPLFGFAAGLATWFLLSWMTRLHLTQLEEPEGLDCSEHGVVRDRTAP